MNLQLRVYSSRVFSVLMEGAANIVFSVIIVKLLNNAEAYGLYSICISSVYVGSYVISFGQDRLLLILMSRFDLMSLHQDRKEYLSFVLFFVLFYLICVFLSALCFYFIPDFTPHPILIGLCFSPYLAMYQISKNLLNIVGYPVLGRYLFICILLFVVIPLLFAVQSYFGTISYVEIAYVMMLSFLAAGVLNLLLSLFCFKFFVEGASQSGSIEINKMQRNYFSKIYHGYLYMIFLLRYEKVDKKHFQEWFSRGLPLGVSYLNDFIYNLIIPLISFSKVSLSLIAFLSIANIFRSFFVYISIVIRNHFMPILASFSFIDNISPIISADDRKKLRAINQVIWMTMIILTVTLLIASAYILKNVYGDEYMAVYPMLLIMLLLSFFVQGWAFHRAIMALFDDLARVLMRIQVMRFFVILLLSSFSVFWFANVYFLIWSVGVTSLICCFIQLFAVYRKTKVFLIWP